MTKFWTATEILTLFRSDKTKTSLYRDEINDLIPKAKRVSRGKTETRMWETSDLPKIALRYGFLREPDVPKIISIYAPKGGVLKSTLAFNLARMLALNNIKTLVIGLDVQGSVTNNLRQEMEVESLEDIKELPGLYEIKKATVSNNGIEAVIQSTDFPNLFYIPESSNLNHLEQHIREESRREHFLERLIKPLKKSFSVILFDNSPNWNFLIQNSLVAATDVICPIACDIETYRSLTQNIQMINDFKEKMELDWNNFILVPTKLERTKISTQIEAQYRMLFPELITTGSIRAAVKGQESSMERLSVVEYASRSNLAADYYDVVMDIWQRINPSLPELTTFKFANASPIEGSV